MRSISIKIRQNW